ncbi:N-6 DNA methylase [Paenibacillus sp. Y412MC10]|uniref:N-6 DNA methylase n=1 Tax=Geobacillus sp. (strain Y412MC10) TaxID=481743 RepID=UPI0011A585C2|nr:N-6 DNA methylase [Paenibacillus sp. Y412MC10]
MGNNMTGLPPAQKRFIELFKTLTHRHRTWQVWSDFIEIAACSISNVLDHRRKNVREANYSSIIEKYNPNEQEIFPLLLAEIVQALELKPEQDFLGDLFMRLELSNHWRGQFFTPYNICQLMAQMQFADLSQTITEKGFVSVNDPACGAGATLIAFANEARSRGINFQQSILFTAQDIDRTAALMCYVQLSLLGCGGYVIIGDSLRNPATESDLDGPDVWYTPLYFMANWPIRRKLQKISKMTMNTPETTLN